MSNSTLPPDLFDTTTLLSLSFVVVLLGLAYFLSLVILERNTPGQLRFLFIWHGFDALIHFFFEGSFLWHCFMSAIPAHSAEAKGAYPDPLNFLGTKGVVHGSQAGGENPFARLWMVYARADRRWGGVDLGVVSLELLTVFVVGPMAVWVCYDIAKKNPRANIIMIMLATAELYGGFMTFCPEWLVGNINLDTSNFMYKWVYLVFFNMIWVFIPIYAIWTSAADIFDAFKVRHSSLASRKSK